MALSTSTARALPGVAEVLRLVAAVRPRPLIVVGGALYTPDVAESATALGADLVIPDVRSLIPALRGRVPARELE